MDEGGLTTTLLRERLRATADQEKLRGRDIKALIRFLAAWAKLNDAARRLDMLAKPDASGVPAEPLTDNGYEADDDGGGGLLAQNVNPNAETFGASIFQNIIGSNILHEAKGMFMAQTAMAMLRAKEAGETALVAKLRAQLGIAESLASPPALSPAIVADNGTHPQETA